MTYLLDTRGTVPRLAAFSYHPTLESDTVPVRCHVPCLHRTYALTAKISHIQSPRITDLLFSSTLRKKTKLKSGCTTSALSSGLLTLVSSRNDAPRSKFLLSDIASSTS